ncbi:hypothetical protein RHSP_20548 [Rhizobium freirei PRF 81]|uniref:Uncharacterized protein n=1 Tax=Rhizobium freirei PRF 81 TaxID=363754 RepID=N6U0Z0_9HYPH|nr:hypothetical protein RHSP_20548 [Rhizobium freirei PRF 81]
MEDGDVHEFAQPLLDDETVGRLDILEIDAAEGRAEITHAIDEFVDILRVDLKVDGIDIGEALEENRFAFHDRLRSQSPKIAEAENGRAVRDDGDHVAARRIVVGRGRIGGDRFHGNGHTGRIGKGEIALCRHRLGRIDLKLAGPAQLVEVQRFLIRDPRPRTRLALAVSHCSSKPPVGDRSLLPDSCCLL